MVIMSMGLSAWEIGLLATIVLSIAMAVAMRVRGVIGNVGLIFAVVVSFLAPINMLLLGAY